jgi:hypothetical protein
MKSETTDKSRTVPEPNIVYLERAAADDEPPLPQHVENSEHQELGSDVDYEWIPEQPYESLEAVLIATVPMKLGGTAYTFLVAPEDNDSYQVLLKKGGRIFDSCMQKVAIGDRVYMRYLGLLEAKPNQNPARDWRVIKFTEK